MEKTQILQNIGLKENEITIYLSLLDHGAGTVMGIAQNTGLHRPVIYKLLPNLEKMGLITRSPRGKRIFYVAESPDKLETLVTEVSSKLQEILPELKTAHAAQGKKPLIKWFEGRAGVMSVFDDLANSLKPGETYYRYSPVESKEKIEQYLSPSYRRIRDQKKLERFVISNEQVRAKAANVLERAIKVIPPESGLFNHNVMQLIYGHKVAFVDFNSETALIIENSKIAEFQKQIFKLLYGQLD